MTQAGKDRQGFTIVELLVVIAAIAILMGVLLVGLQSASRMTRNIRTMSRLKQVHIAWTTYSNAYNDKVLPGYLAPEVQENWRVRYKDPDGERLAAGECTTYPWRLLPYLDFDLDPMFGYRSDMQELKNNYGNPDAPGHEAAHATIAAAPAFGYNAYYVGGWWVEREDRSFLTFGNAIAELDVGGTLVETKGRLVATSMGQIPQPENLIAFSCSTYRNPGDYVIQDDNPDGAAWVVPQRLADVQIWRPFMGDVQVGISSGASVIPVQAAGDGIQVLVSQAVPLRRHGITIPILNCDGSTQQESIDQLLKMDRWIPSAIDAPGNTTLFQHQPDSP